VVGIILIPLDKDSKVYLYWKPGPIPPAEILGVSFKGTPYRWGRMKALDRLKAFARIAGRCSADDPMPPGLYRLMLFLGDDIGDQQWFCDGGFYERGPEDLERSEEELMRLPLCRLLEALLYLIRFERHDGYWGTVVGRAWKRGWIQAVARGVERRLMQGEYPRRSPRGWSG